MIPKYLILLFISLILISCGDGENPFSRKMRDFDDRGDNKDIESSREQENAFTGIAIKNLPSILAKLKLNAYHQAGFRGQNTTIAILDNGFEGLEHALNRTLPPDIEYIAASQEQGLETLHGTKLAELVYAVATGSKTYEPGLAAPEIKLMVTSGPYENLDRAIDLLVDYKKQNPRRTIIALYSQIWEYGGNGDGTGYINNAVNRATNAGIIWINAVGNLGKSTYTGKIELNRKGEVILPTEERYLKLRIPAAGSDAKIVLAWGDFTNSYYHYRTSQDLDLILEDEEGVELARADLIQDGRDHGGATGYSRHAREVIQARSLKGGVYRLRVVARTRNFERETRFWIAVSGRDVSLDDGNGDKMVFMPADNPNVLAIGADDVDYGNRLVTNDKVLKPDLLTSSIIEYDDDVVIHGTSTAAAIAAGALASYASSHIIMTKPMISTLIKNGKIATLPNAKNTPPTLRLPAPYVLPDP